MATGFHIATIGWSVRNLLALEGPAHPLRMTARLQELYHPGISEEEIRRACGELERRGLIKPIGADRFVATHKTILQFRPHVQEAMREDDERAWQGWH